MVGASKITAAHLRRDACVYVRQSTVGQVREHRESLQRQYELAEGAVELGWPSSRVVVIDADLGRSGAESAARAGFQQLVANVGPGQVGLILGIEVSRLARNNADWYQLLDLCEAGRAADQPRGVRHVRSRAVRQIVCGYGIAFQRTETFKLSPDPGFKAKKLRIPLFSH